ncbi:NAD(P)H-dependent oxidoreductase [Acuticoccus sp. M5D2P5]|uniref:NADPH-dependent FMN reductase n=1 Tax=Acuticoccus kalidii TaxID=2910977 RepID=UPI001F376922|nr:NADPH-dependent FMN reductase [Acuticoccus kalidii]MCF3935725.1 NAD(P)H-dependent oxidoreductase [Acuticoccus kalidii]
MKTIAVLVGSLRKGSINLRFAQALEKLAGDRFRFVYPDLGAIPHYNEDLWADLPESVSTLKRQIEESDAVLFVTPEYNRTFAPILANTIAWASRPYGKSSFLGKPGAVIGTSPGPIGSAAGQMHLRALLPVVGIVQLGQPEVYLQWKPDIVNEDLAFTDEGTRDFLLRWINAFDRFVGQTAIAA